MFHTHALEITKQRKSMGKHQKRNFKTILQQIFEWQGTYVLLGTKWTNNPNDSWAPKDIESLGTKFKDWYKTNGYFQQS